MGVFPGFGAWNNQNGESNRSENVESKSESDKDTNAKAERDEELKQSKLWYDAEMKHPWYDAPPQVKVTTKNGLCHMHIEFTVGMTPGAVFFQLTQRNTSPFFDFDKWRHLLEIKSTKVLKDDGPRQIVKYKKLLTCDFLWWSGTLPIYLIVYENRKDLTAKYKKEKMIFMKVFEGSFKVEPIYVDQERLCKHMRPKTRKEYKKCSGGQGKVASKVVMDQYFQPYTLLNLPPISWYIREKTIKTTKTLIETLQKMCSELRSSDPTRIGLNANDIPEQ
ncbi:hypothetical protein AALP_AA3G330000 [Arabis alpina]|uniref:DUF220 domain-containing protein n=1 Tax=Arabis alpina TaxID=50452 RepID=A0A087HD95_ARAAL|nr:hypothetical protein AALP_AA3G330000 [Arabis alpina]